MKNRLPFSILPNNFDSKFTKYTCVFSFDFQSQTFKSTGKLIKIVNNFIDEKY